MAALSGANVTSLRAGGHRAKTYLSVAPDSTVATARINQSSFTRPLASLTVDTTSGWTDIQPGMSAWIGTTSGARDIGVYRVRGSDTTTLDIGEMSTGDTGLLPLSNLQPFIDNAYVTIKKDFNAWSVFSKITYSGGVDARSGTFYKDYDIAYDDHNSTEPHCPLNLGEHRAGFISGGTIDFDFTATASPFVGSVSTYLWDVDGASITSGTSGDQNITVQFSEGFYVVSCTVTLSTGKAMTGYRAVFAHGSTLEPYVIDITSDRRDIHGRRVQFRTRQDVDELRTGNFVLLWHDMSWGGNDIVTASKQFVGWTREITDTAQRANREHSFEVISGLETLKDAVAFGQQLVVKSSPASWAEVSSSLATMDYWLFYLLHYHTTLLKLFDLELSSLTDTTQTWSVSTADIHQQVNQSAQRQDCSVGQASNGTIYVRQDPTMMDETDRDAVAERMTITDADLLEPATFTHILRPKAYAVEAGSFDYSGGTLTAYLSKAPGNVGTQGKSAPKLSGRIGDQTAINLISANALAKENNPYADVNLTLGGLYDVFEPSHREWIRVTLSADYSPTGAAFNERCLIKTMTIQYLEHGHRRVALTLEVETAGYDTPGETQPIRYPDSGNAGILSGNTLINFPQYDSITGLLDLPHYPFDDYDLPYPEITYDDTTSDYAIALQAALLSIADDANTASPDYEALYTSGGETLLDFAYTGSTETTLQVMLLADDAIRLNSDALGSGTFTSKQTFTGGQIIRKLAGVSGGYAIFGADITSGSWTETIDLTASDGGFTAAPPAGGGTGATWTNGVGWQGVTNGTSPSFERSIRIELTGLQPFECTEVVLTYDMTAGVGSQFARVVANLNLAGETNMGQTGTPNTGAGVTFTATTDASDTIALHITLQCSSAATEGALTGSVTLTQIAISGTGFDPFNDVAWIRYTGDSGDSITKITTGTYGATTAGDSDDFNLGVHVATAARGIEYTTSYTGASSTLSGLTGIDGAEEVHAIRIPFKVLASQALNNTATALQFIYATSASSNNVQGISFNSSTGAINAQSDMTPVVSGTTYRCIAYPNAIAFSGRDSRVALLLGEDVASPGTTYVLRTANGGATWFLGNGGTAVSYTRVEWEPDSANRAWFSGGTPGSNAGVALTIDAGVTLSARNGDLPSNDVEVAYGLV